MKIHNVKRTSPLDTWESKGNKSNNCLLHNVMQQPDDDVLDSTLGELRLKRTSNKASLQERRIVKQVIEKSQIRN